MDGWMEHPSNALVNTLKTLKNQQPYDSTDGWMDEWMDDYGWMEHPSNLYRTHSYHILQNIPHKLSIEMYKNRSI